MTTAETTASNNAWPFEQAQRVRAHLAQVGKTTADTVLFATGFGASGLPHIGTFSEVFRTTLVLRAFQYLYPEYPHVQLMSFSDDLDGLRKVPTNLPQQEMLRAHLHKPVSAIPDPFDQYPSFAAYNNAKLRAFLDQFGFHYTFYSATECYQSGRFNGALQDILRHHQTLVDIVAPTLGDERRETYSPFLPICPETGQVLQVPVVATDPAQSTITYRREDGQEVVTSVLDGKCKLQWKADWAMRWVALGVDYEMSGKDLIDSVTIGQKITRALGATPPVSFTYEHFVDAQGAKISKSKGNGLTIEEWLRYGPPESLGLFMYHRPERAKKLFLDVIPKTVDEYNDLLQTYHTLPADVQRYSSVWHIHAQNVPPAYPVSYNMLLNLLTAAAENATPELLWGFIERYKPGVNPTTAPQLEALISGAICYYKDHILPHKTYHIPTPQERTYLEGVLHLLGTLQGIENAEDIQTAFYTLGKDYFDKAELRQWFKFLYQTLFGTDQGPRLGAFVLIYGIANTRALVERALARRNSN